MASRFLCNLTSEAEVLLILPNVDKAQCFKISSTGHSDISWKSLTESTDVAFYGNIEFAGVLANSGESMGLGIVPGCIILTGRAEAFPQIYMEYLRDPRRNSYPGLFLTEQSVLAFSGNQMKVLGKGHAVVFNLNKDSDDGRKKVDIHQYQAGETFSWPLK